MRVTIILDTGAFLHEAEEGLPHIDVGYFETPGVSDIEVSVDGRQVQPPPNPKLGKGNKTIKVEHVSADGTTVKTGIDRSLSFKNDLLLKGDLYDDSKDVPDFVDTEYDCKLRFHSGTFESSDVRDCRFKKYRVSDDVDTTDDKHTRRVAHDILVHYDLGDGEILRLRREDASDAWSSASVGAATKLVEVKLLSHDSLISSYHKKALAHKGPHYYMPNPDPPPMNGKRGG